MLNIKQDHWKNKLSSMLFSDTYLQREKNAEKNTILVKQVVGII